MSATNEDVREVSFEEALAEETDQGAPQSESGGENPLTPRPRPTQHQEGQPEGSEVMAEPEKPDDLEVLAPKIGAKQWTLGTGDFQKTYVQRELSVLGKAQWFSLVGEILDSALSGDNALSLNSLLTPPTPRAGGSLSPTDFQDADTFVHAVGKLMEHSPTFLYKSICIWLDVPDYEWELVKDMMRRSPEQGGMSDDEFEEIFAIFIDQNYGQMIRFFQERFPRLRERWQARQTEIRERRLHLLKR